MFLVPLAYSQVDLQTPFRDCGYNGALFCDADCEGSKDAQYQFYGLPLEITRRVLGELGAL